MDIDLRSKNDNLQDWRNKKSKITEALLKKAIEHLYKSNEKISQKNVSFIMNEIATDEEKNHHANISPSAISKNENYKLLIFEAQEKQNIKKSKLNSISKDAQRNLEIHKLKTIIAEKEARIKEYESIINRADIDIVSLKDIKEDIDYKILVQDFISLSLKEGIIYKDKNGNLVSEIDNKIILSKIIYKRLLEK
ncbi:hypothetical protein [Halarcobacter sp.]|uniref:hypothetical protein n=1 Tax=Halarcobacter sp. TaxID=2321133 RepID=UPI003A949AC3